MDQSDKKTESEREREREKYRAVICIVLGERMDDELRQQEGYLNVGLALILKYVDTLQCLLLFSS